MEEEVGSELETLRRVPAGSAQRTLELFEWFYSKRLRIPCWNEKIKKLVDDVGRMDTCKEPEPMWGCCGLFLCITHSVFLIFVL